MILFESAGVKYAHCDTHAHKGLPASVVTKIYVIYKVGGVEFIVCKEKIN